MVVKHNARRNLTGRESGAKYVAKGRALDGLLKQDASGEPEGNAGHVDGAPEPLDYTAKFIAICRILLDVGPWGAGRGSYESTCGASGLTPRFEIDSTFCPAPEGTTTLVHSPAGTEPAGG